MNEAHVRTPARLTAINRIQFRLSLPRGPQGFKVVVIFSQRAKLFAQLARADGAVVINHGNRFPGRAGERPGRRAIKVCALRAVMSRDRANVSDVLGETLGTIVIGKHAITVALGQLGHVGIHLRQRIRRHLLDFIADQRLSAHQIEVLAVEPKVLSHELAEFFNLPVIVRTNDRVGV